MFLLPVHTRDSETEWLNLPLKWYRKFANKPLMLVDDTEKVFDPSRNSFLQNGSVKRWLIYDCYNLCAGRIAAYYGPEDRKGRIGFFESLNNKDVAFELFDAAKNWLKENGCRAIEGPLNFGEKDRFWGLMTNGFDSKGLYLDNYNPEYYQDLFRSYGFKPKDQIFTYHLPLNKLPEERIRRTAEWSRIKYGLEYVSFDWDKLEQFLPDIHLIYRSSFRADTRISHLTIEDIRHLLMQAKPFLKEKYFQMAYKKRKPVGFLIFLQEPSVHLYSTPSPLLKGFAFATIPEVRAQGVEIGLACRFMEQLQREGGNQSLMLSGINAGTVKMNSLLQKLGGVISKIHHTFYYEINEHE